MKRTTTAIIGAGQSGLAMSHELTRCSVDHVILERGQIANSWRTERWDSLKTLTPNWMNRLPDQRPDDADIDGFMTAQELVQNFDTFASDNTEPVKTETSVMSVDGTPGQYVVQTDQGAISCEAVVMANGACAIPKMPAFADQLPKQLSVFTPKTYKRPSQLPDGKVLIVGASASGLQLAYELQQSGKQVLLAVGNHLRFPRSYRGADILMWLEMLGQTSIPYTEVDDLARVRRTPSLTLTAGRTLDLNVLQSVGVELTGRLVGVDGLRALFSGSLANQCAAADMKMNRLLALIDQWLDGNGLSALFPLDESYDRTYYPKNPRLVIDLVDEGFGSVVMATGYRPDFSWLNLPVFDRKGQIVHDGGLVGEGLYAMGLPYLRQRKSTYIHGAGDDARALAAHLIAHLDRRFAA